MYRRICSKRDLDLIRGSNFREYVSRSDEVVFRLGANVDFIFQ
jgi:hypothetical protein